jgi:hypothetical protein
MAGAELLARQAARQEHEQERPEPVDELRLGHGRGPHGRHEQGLLAEEAQDPEGMGAQGHGGQEAEPPRRGGPGEPHRAAQGHAERDQEERRHGRRVDEQENQGRPDQDGREADGRGAGAGHGAPARAAG